MRALLRTDCPLQLTADTLKVYWLAVVRLWTMYDRFMEFEDPSYIV